MYVVGFDKWLVGSMYVADHLSKFVGINFCVWKAAFFLSVYYPHYYSY